MVRLVLAYTATLIICSLKPLMIIQVVNIRGSMLQRPSDSKFLGFIQLLEKCLLGIATQNAFPAVAVNSSGPFLSCLSTWNRHEADKDNHTKQN